MLEQLITELISALNANTAALKAASNLTVTSSPAATTSTTTVVVETAPPPAEEKPKAGRKAKADTAKPAAPAVQDSDVTQVIPREEVEKALANAKAVAAAEKKPRTLEEVRELGADILALTGDTQVIREYVTKVLPNETKPSLRLLQPHQFEEAYEFLSGVIAKLPPAVVEEYRAKKNPKAA